MNLVSLSARNLFRNRLRTTLTVLGVAVALVGYVLLRTVIVAWNVAADHAAKDRIATRHKVSFIMQLPLRYIDIVRQVEGVKAATHANWFGGKDPKDPNNFFPTLAVDPKTFLEVYDEISVTPEVRERWLTNRQSALVGDVLARKLGVQAGDRITLTGTIYPGDWQFLVAGIYTATRRSMDRSEFLFHWSYLNDSIPTNRRDEIGWIVSRIDDPRKSGAISAAIDRVFDVQDIQTLTMSERALNLSFMAMFSAILKAVDIISVIILLILFLILGNTIAMGVRERTNEYGVLRALGFLPKHVRAFILSEAMFLGAASGVLGVALSYPIVELGMGRWLEENMGASFPYFRVSPVTLAVAFGAGIALAAGAAILPSLRASRLSVTDALRRRD